MLRRRSLSHAAFDTLLTPPGAPLPFRHRRGNTPLHFAVLHCKNESYRCGASPAACLHSSTTLVGTSLKTHFSLPASPAATSAS